MAQQQILKRPRRAPVREVDEEEDADFLSTIVTSSTSAPSNKQPADAPISGHTCEGELSEKEAAAFRKALRSRALFRGKEDADLGRFAGLISDKLQVDYALDGNAFLRSSADALRVVARIITPRSKQELTDTIRRFADSIPVIAERALSRSPNQSFLQEVQEGYALLKKFGFEQEFLNLRSEAE
ncbi:MAG: hypothetical protein DCC75_02950 [Proteobacteria bacterium]|nr:MAG: hypothetical protein DCC75_02950 [Pseudomonadota bacterium]